MPKIWSQYEDSISVYYLSALINDDYTGMPDYEVHKFNRWKASIEQSAINDGWIVGHWTTDHEDGAEWYGFCSVSGLRSNLADVSLMVYKN